MMIQRLEYLNFLTEWKDQPIIKVVTGIRRCGKSTLFDLFREYLYTIGTEETQIISINYEEADCGILTEIWNIIRYHGQCGTKTFWSVSLRR